MGNSDFITQIITFVNELFKSLNSGYLFLGSSWDFVRYIIDIAVVTAMFYWLFTFVRQTRAWQLIKGIVLVLIFVFFCSIIGMDMVSFLFNRLLYVFAILFIILFQPELRRVLETVGLRTSGQVRGIFSKKNEEQTNPTKTMLNEICDACSVMSQSYTGALILIERNTKLNELAEQENAVHFESTVTSSVLQSIFYKGSPMHDGALLIRDNVIIAARCHVPLSITMHELEKTGTRHRAAVGASELGDTVVVVVSEERGTMSIAVNGKLFEMGSKEELKANLMYLMGLAVPQDKKTASRGKKKKASSNQPLVTQAEAAGIEAEKTEVRTQNALDSNGFQHISRGQKAFFLVVSFILAMTLWLYIQVQNNPVVTKTLTVPIQYETENMPQGIDASRPVKTCELTVVGRQNYISNIDAADVKAYIDYSQLDVASTGIYNLDVKIESNGSFRVERQLPDKVSVTVYSVN